MLEIKITQIENLFQKHHFTGLSLDFITELMRYSLAPE